MRPLQSGRTFRHGSLIFILWASSTAPAAECGRSEYVMGTMLHVRAWSGSEATACRALDSIFRIVHDLDRKLSNYRQDSEISRLNRAGSGWTTVSAETADFLAQTWSWTRRSRGALNPLIGPLVELWGFFDGDYRVPDSAEIKRLLPATDPERLLTGGPDSSYRLEGGATVDPGATGKGFALQQADRAVADLELSAILYDFGGQIFYRGDSVRCHAVRHPRNDSEVVSVACFAHASLATSGDYEKYFVADGERYAHILDPRSGWPIRGRASVTVLAADPMTADALSTALFVLGPVESVQLLSHYPGVGALFAEWDADTLLFVPVGDWESYEAP